MFWTQVFFQIYILLVFSPTWWLAFACSQWGLSKCRSFWFWWSPVYQCFSFMLFCVLRKLCLPRSQRFSPRIFIILAFMFRSRIHFELIFVYGVRLGLMSIFSHIQHHLLKWLSSLHSPAVVPLLKFTWPCTCGLFLWFVFHWSVYLSVCQLPHSLWLYFMESTEITYCKSSTFVLLLQNCFAYSSPLFPYDFLYTF